MKDFHRFISSLVIISLLSGCAASNTRMIEDGNSLSDARFCRNYLNDYFDLQAKNLNDSLSLEEYRYFEALKEQDRRRNLTTEECRELVDDKNTAIIAASLLAIIAAAAVANGGSGGSYSNDYAWDQFNDGYGNLVWRCRDKSNGQFAYDSNCASEYKVDSTWPSK